MTSSVESGIPAEAERDASEELERLNLADAFDPLAAGGDNYLAPVVVPAEEQASEMRAPVGGTPRVLEDLYAENPDIGNGQKFMRINRRQPLTYQGQRIAGFITDLHEQMTMGDFAQRFGGGTYDVCVMGVMRSALEGDEAKLRTLRVLRLDIPGRPIAMGVVQMQSPFEGSSMSQRQGGVFTGDQAAAQVEIAKINAEQQTRMRQDAERQQLYQASLRNQQPSANLLSQIDEAADRRAQEVKASLLETLNIERKRVERLQADLEAREAQVQKLRETLLEEQTKVATRMREEESAREREMKARYEMQLEELKKSGERLLTDTKKSHEEEIRRVTQDAAANFQRVTETATRDMAELSRRRDDERKQYEANAEKERERLREDGQRREQQLTQDASLREAAAQRQNEDRLRDLERSYKRENESLTVAQQRELDSIRTNERSSSVIVEKTAEIQIRSMQSDIARLEARNASQEAELERLRSQVHRTPMEAIREANELIELTSGGKQEATAPEEFSWQKAIVQVIKGAVDKAPEVFKGIEEARVHNQVARAGGMPQQQIQAGYHRQQQMMPQQMQQQQMAPYAQQMQPQQQQQPRRAYRPPAIPGAVPPAWGTGVGATADPASNQYLPPTGPPNMAAVQPVQPKFVTPIGANGKLPEPAPVPVSGQEISASPASAFTPFETPPQMPQPAQQQAPEQTQQQVAAVPQAAAPTSEQIGQFVEHLELAVSTGLATPTQFAAEFVKEAGPDATRMVLGAMTADQFVDQIAEHKGGSTPLATHDGRKYVRELWTEANKAAGG